MPDILQYLDFYASLIPKNLGWKIRRFLFRNRIQMGKNVKIDELVSITSPEKISLGSNSYIGRSSILNARGGLLIGKNVLIGPHVHIWTDEHIFKDPSRPIITQGHTFGKVTIGDDVYIGGGVTILKGVTIGKGAIIGTRSIVNKDVNSFSIVAGSPARKIATR
jgi:acetyltransferase-like isoleucine patch superfamily enzyme